ncbi:MAG: triphosphoribosyl-dephospho-CoA synthase CitG [Lachnospiraceae bacterium]|nr:triphosphoribosyl-dephospho-CoA synthase CitG [Lachnospiraceae bacterium]
MSSSPTTQEVSLLQMLDAREKRAQRQNELLTQYQKPLLCFTMNIAGPIKNSPLIQKGFLAGAEDIKLQFIRNKLPILHQEVINEITGNEAFYVIDGDGFFIKQLACEVEDSGELGRLFDMDVILPPGKKHPHGRKLDRQDLGYLSRTCLICGAPAKECSSRRIHPVSALQQKAKTILEHALKTRYACQIAELAVRSLLYEVSVSPKPGLVDRFNNGSHRDMDFYTFLNSAASLWPYFNECARVGLNYAFSEHTQTQESSLQELFQSLRIPGKFAENRMLKATKGTNTHKGAVFSMGILCAAIGACGLSDWSSPEKILMTCSQMTSGLVDLDFSGLTLENAKTMGQKLYLNYGITGVRGEMEAGLPTVKNYGLPLLEQLLAEGKSIDETGAAVLLTILAHMTDTNLISRSDIETQKAAANTARELLQKNPCPSKAALEQLDQDFIQKNLSPGGSADLLAVCWMLYFIKTSGMDPEKKYRK